MPNVKNQETLVKIKEDLDGVSAMWVVDYCGLTVKDIQALRTAIRESGEELLAQIAGAISGVARGLAVALNGGPSGLAQVTKAVADQKEAA